jgi:tRNA-dihydrouridine synthase
MDTSRLPWATGSFPLMLAPMQGVTNRIVRNYFVEQVRPDVLFTEFVRVSGVDPARIPRRDRAELAASEGGVPLVVQLIGRGVKELSEAAVMVVNAGVQHLNLNLGCPYGRTASGCTGGNTLRTPEVLPDILAALRAAIPGSFSVKIRAGYDNPRQIFSLLPLFEQSAIDFLILHPRTVLQQYKGHADHTLTAEVVRATSLPVIANGDIVSATQGLRLREEARPAGLMLGRGAIADPRLFARLRQNETATPTMVERQQGLARMLTALAPDYRTTFCGDAQVLGKLKALLSCVESDALSAMTKPLKRAKRLDTFLDFLNKFQ